MRSVYIGVLSSVCLFIGACNVNITETQDIEITHFSNGEQNKELAEALTYYDPLYLAHKIPAFDGATSRGIRIGYFVRSNDGTPSYRITYDLTVDAVSENLADLRSQFEAYIPVLAAQHVSKEPLFLELQPLGLSWAEAFFSEDASTLLEQSSQLLQESVTATQLSSLQNEASTWLGSPTGFEFVRAQFYEEFGEVPESVSLFYEIEMSNGTALIFRVSLHEVESEWQAIGFEYQQIR